MATALICSTFIHHVDHAWSFAIRVGLVTGIVTGVGITVNPYIEYYADNLPSRRLGAFGIGLILCGFALQSLQYWLALFHVRLTYPVEAPTPRCHTNSDATSTQTAIRTGILSGPSTETFTAAP